MSTLAIYSRRIRLSLRGCRPKLSLQLQLFEEEFCLNFFGFIITLPFLDRWHREPHEILESWGFYWSGDIVLCWGDKCKFIHMPWEFRHVKTEVLRPDGTWVPRVASYETGKSITNSKGVVVIEGGKEPDGRETWTLPYRYCLRRSSWEVQQRTATIHVERMEWRRKWTRWCPWFAKVRQYIEVEFSDEVGERTGSWKGGCIGCSYEMRKGETPQETLRRMEQERKF